MGKKTFATSFCLALLLVATSALAAPAIATSVEPARKGERRYEVDLGMLIGGTDIGQTQKSTVGLHLNAGRRYGDLVVLGEFDHLALGRSVTGTLNRVGVMARYSLLRTSGEPDRRGRRFPLSGDFWFEGGVGAERITWDDGGRLTRPDLAFGFGWQFNVLIDRNGERPRYYGPYVAFRAHLARAPESQGGEVTCAGPCDSPSGPPLNDLSMFFHMGINWGK